MKQFGSLQAASSKLLAFIVLSSGMGANFSVPEPVVQPPTGCYSPMPAIQRGAESLAADFLVNVDPGLQWNINGGLNPTLTLTRGQSYTFDLTGVGGQHPFVINSNGANAGGTIYAGPASGTTISFTPDQVMPATIYYHCTVHFTSMVGTINLVSAADIVVNVDPGLQWDINGGLNPTLTLVRGQSYTFDLTGVGGQHPFVINSNAANAGGTVYAGPATGTTFNFTPDFVMPSTIYYHCTVHFTSMVGTINLVSPPIQVAIKAFLEGPFNGTTMNDGLRSGGHIPTTEPFTGLSYTHTGGGGGETIDPAVLLVTGNNAIVDWVLVEMRSNLVPTTRLATQSALIQRDGDVVGVDGVSPVQFALAAGTYKVALRHRNHLGVMTLNGIVFGAAVVSIDLSLASTACFGTDARKTAGAFELLWMGDASFNGELLYVGSGNDRDPILVAIGGSTPTSTAAGYLATDLNMDGTARYVGAFNDRDPILVNIGGSLPTASRAAQLP